MSSLLHNLELHPHSNSLIQFTKNTSLKRFVFRAELDIVIEHLTFLFKHAHFAPQLETLVIVISHFSSPDYFPSFASLKLLDQHVRSRPSISKIIVSRDRVRERPDWIVQDEKKKWQLLETEMKRHLPWCEESHLIEFNQGSWGLHESSLLCY